MGNIIVRLDDELEKKFRETCARLYGLRWGFITKGVTEAISFWLANMDGSSPSDAERIRELEEELRRKDRYIRQLEEKLEKLAGAAMEGGARERNGERAAIGRALEAMRGEGLLDEETFRRLSARLREGVG